MDPLRKSANGFKPVRRRANQQRPSRPDFVGLEGGSISNIDSVHANTSGQENRRGIETDNERLVVVRHGLQTEIRAFAIPVLVEFTKDVPDSQLEGALTLLGQDHCQEAMIDLGVERSQTTIIPRFFRLRELATIPIASMRRDMLSLAGDPCHGLTDAISNAPLRRTRVFLRYLVGISVTRLGTRPAEPQPPRACERFEHQTMQALSKRMRSECHVKAYYTGAFYDPLYTGMWLYQNVRLGHIAAQSGNLDPQVSAAVVVDSRTALPSLKLVFDSPWTPTYVLNVRPSENLKRAAVRVRDHLESLGLPSTAIYIENAPGEKKPVRLSADSTVALPL